MLLRLPALQLIAAVTLGALGLIACSGKSVGDLEVGDCFVQPEASPGESIDVARVETVECNEPHDGEVTAVFDLEGDDYPGEDAISEIALEQCPFKTSFFFYPKEDESWSKGDRQVVCILESIFDLKVGDCIVPPDISVGEPSEVARVKRVDCTEPHDGEVTLVFDLELDEYPGDAAMPDIAIEECPDRSSTALYPTGESWARGDRGVTCVLLSLFDLRVGDCINYSTEDVILGGVQRVDCADAHDGKVIHLVEMPDGDFPGDEGVADYAAENCPSTLDFYLGPIEESWAQGDREIVCIDE